MVIFTNNKHFMKLPDIGYCGNYYNWEDFKLNRSFKVTVFRTYIKCHFI